MSSSPSSSGDELVDTNLNTDSETTTTASVVDQYNPALIVINMQHDFVHGSLQVPDAASLIEPINALLELPFAMYAATRDYHPQDHVSFAQTHQKPAFSEHTVFHPDYSAAAAATRLQPIIEEQQQQTLWPMHCVADTDGADFVEGLHADKFDAVVHKGTHPHIASYSAFRDVWSTRPSELAAQLQKMGVTDVYFAGIAGDYSVKYSAFDAVDCGYNVWVIRDALRSISSDMVAEEELRDKGVRFTTIDEVVQRLKTVEESPGIHIQKAQALVEPIN